MEHLREYIAELEDELQWETTFNNTQDQLVAAALRDKQEIAEGKAEPMDFDQLSNPVATGEICSHYQKHNTV